MVGTPRTGFGALLQKGDGASPENFVSILGIKSISGPDISRDTHDTTDMLQADQFRRFIGGLVDGGSGSFDANWLPLDPTQNQDEGGLMAEFDKESCESSGNWRIVTPSCPGEDEVSVDFAGVLSGSSFEIPMDDLMAFTGEIKVSGRVALDITTAA